MITKTTASPFKKSGGDIVPLDTDAKLGIGLTSPVGTIAVDTGSGGWSVTEVSLDDDANVALETILPGQQGYLWIIDVSTNAYKVAGSVYLEGDDNTARSVLDTTGRISISASPSEGQLGVQADGDGTYTMYNKILDKTFALMWLGTD